MSPWQPLWLLSVVPASFLREASACDPTNTERLLQTDHEPGYQSRRHYERQVPPGRSGWLPGPTQRGHSEAAQRARWRRNDTDVMGCVPRQPWRAPAYCGKRVSVVKFPKQPIAQTIASIETNLTFCSAVPFANWSTCWTINKQVWRCHCHMAMCISHFLPSEKSVVRAIYRLETWLLCTYNILSLIYGSFYL